MTFPYFYAEDPWAWTKAATKKTNVGSSENWEKKSLEISEEEQTNPLWLDLPSSQLVPESQDKILAWFKSPFQHSCQVVTNYMLTCPK